MSKMPKYNGVFKSTVEGWRCPYCAKPVGYLGRFFARILGTQIHGCDFSNTRSKPGLYEIDRAMKAALSNRGEHHD